MKRGDHLPEQLFSDLCGVSRTPVRAAFRILLQGNVLSWREEEGYFLAADRAEDLAPALAAITDLEQSLAQKILADRSHRRIGDIQSVSALARRYGASRHAVLNALKILSQDGIVAQLPGRSWAFQPMLDSPAAVDQSLAFRLTLEPQAIREPGFALDRKKASAVAARMQDLLAAGEGRIAAAVFHATDTDFHSFIAEGSANRFLRSALIAHQRLRRATQAEVAIPDFRQRQALREHLEILESLLSNQFDLAADQMVLHLRRSRTARPEAVNRGAPPMARAAHG